MGLPITSNLNAMAASKVIDEAAAKLKADGVAINDIIYALIGRAKIEIIFHPLGDVAERKRDAADYLLA